MCTTLGAGAPFHDDSHTGTRPSSVTTTSSTRFVAVSREMAAILSAFGNASDRSPMQTCGCSRSLGLQSPTQNGTRSCEIGFLNVFNCLWSLWKNFFHNGKYDYGGGLGRPSAPPRVVECDAGHEALASRGLRATSQWAEARAAYDSPRR